MPINEKLSTPTRSQGDLFPSSPDSRFSSPSICNLNGWTPNRPGGRVNLWQLGLNSDIGVESSPARFTAFQTPSSLDLTPNTNDLSDCSGQKNDNCKRGRPRADVISHLILEGSSSPIGIKCKVCNRVFPREKSLQAHLRTHTGERPYICDYPGCSRAFTQSGQLKTHQRLHAGEKPFVCSSPGCGNRYTHANRTCPLHPYHKPQRSSEVVLQPTLSAGEDPDQVSRWLDNYRRERIEKTPAKVGTNSTNPFYESSVLDSPQLPPTPTSETQLPIDITVSATSRFVSSAIESLMPSKKSKTKRGLASELEQENLVSTYLLHSPSKIPCTEATSNEASNSGLSFIPSALLPRSPVKSGLQFLPTDLSPSVSRRPALGDITPAGNSGSQSPLSLSPNRRFAMRRTPPVSPIKTLNLKKRWLKEVVQDERRQSLTPNSPPKQQQQQSRHAIQVDEEQDSENLALPIRWSESDNEATYAAMRFRRSPLAWSAISALVEMAERENTSSLNNQPLNLSTSKN